MKNSKGIPPEVLLPVHGFPRTNLLRRDIYILCSLCMRVVVACRVMAAEEAHASVRKEDGTPSTCTTIPPARAARHPHADELAAAGG